MLMVNLPTLFLVVAAGERELVELGLGLLRGSGRRRVSTLVNHVPYLEHSREYYQQLVLLGRVGSITVFPTPLIIVILNSHHNFGGIPPQQYTCSGAVATRMKACFALIWLTAIDWLDSHKGLP